MASSMKYYCMRRAALIESLGGICQNCGDNWKLEFHHPLGNGQAHIGGWQQIYKLEFEIGNDMPVKLLCQKCHKLAHGSDSP